MPLKKMQFQAGINRDWTAYGNTGGWWDCDLMRFRNGLPESMGGWTLVTSTQLAGVCRSIHSWTAIDGTEWSSFGTNYKFYVEKGGEVTNVTPIRTSATALSTDALLTTSGSTTVQVGHTSHGAGINDFVTLAGAVCSNLVDSEVNAEHQITAIVDANIYEIEVTTAATGTGADGGGSITAEYQINTGSATAVGGVGFGAGVFGGGPVPREQDALGTDPLDTTNTSTTVTVNDTGHGAADGDWVILSGISSAVNGIPITELNKAHLINYVNANSYTITVQTAATASSSGGGASVVATYYEESDVGWGDSAISGAYTTPRLWSQDNYGEDLIMCPRDGGLYYWDKTTPSTAAVEFSTISGMDADAPTIAKEVAVSAARHVIAFGCDEVGSATTDPLLIRWSDTEDYKTWFPTSENAAGRLRVEHGSFFVTHLETRQEILVWTDTAILSMQYLGPPYIYGITPIATNVTMFGPLAKATANDVTYWMGTDNFYMYDGRVQPIPCTVWDYVFGNINQDATYQVVCGTNRAFSEIIWFYPSSGSLVNDRYVIYNYKDNLWYFGTGFARTAWLDRGFDEKPRGVSSDGYIFYHEDGFNDGSASPPTALSPYIESSPFEIQDGEYFAFMWRIIPDITFRSSPMANPTATVSITPLRNPGSARGTAETKDIDRSTAVTASVEQYTDTLYMRARGRAFILKVSSSEIDTGWRIGVPRIDVRTDGRR